MTARAASTRYLSLVTLFYNCSLLKEAAPLEDKRIVEMGDQVYRHYDDSADSDAILLDERKLLSRYGIWLMVELAVPREQLPIVSVV